MANSKQPSAMSLYEEERHKRVSRMVGYCLTLSTVEGWKGLVPVLIARLTVNERKWLACMSLQALDEPDAIEVGRDVLGQEGRGMPIAAFDGVVDEAAFWADMAEPDELDAYCLACFNRMEANRQKQFLSYVSNLPIGLDTAPDADLREAA